ncbi:MAG: FCD domain-containing protein [Rhizobiales bacterium]|nr:FCD domain-containing protein [Hyphomicrobiales bacterium]
MTFQPSSTIGPTMFETSKSPPRKIEVRSIRDRVYEQIKALIVEGYFQADERFDLNQLARELGVSKTPLNEAVQRLESEGLLTVRPRSGTFVSSVDEREVREAFEVRRMLEVGAADFIIDRIEDDEVAEVAALTGRMEALLTEGDYQEIVREFITLDDRMHATILAASRHRLLIDTYGRVNTLLLVSRVRGKFQREDSLQTIEEHRAICAALEARDRRAYRKAIAAHMDAAIARLSRAMATAGTS